MLSAFPYLISPATYSSLVRTPFDIQLWCPSGIRLSIAIFIMTREELLLQALELRASVCIIKGCGTSLTQVIDLILISTNIWSFLNLCSKSSHVSTYVRPDYTKTLVHRVPSLSLPCLVL